MTQSTFIVGALIAAFVLIVAARGRLPAYASVLWGPAPGMTGGGRDTTATVPYGRSGGREPADAPPGSHPEGYELPDIGDYFPGMYELDAGDLATVFKVAMFAL